jgi:thymidylate synthase
MADHVYRNITAATVAGMAELLRNGKTSNVRGQEVRELLNRVTVIKKPLERCLFLKHRGNSVFASVAETIWVLAGRNDIEWLTSYLPRAIEFSDDGSTWDGAYGPRLRAWNGVDQLDRVRCALSAERASRRAVMTLYDPSRDILSSKDVPCNNWLHWLIREDCLHLNIAVRSNDIVWGFSGVNSFEWSVLQEMMAFWTKAQTGHSTYFASSFHMYERHYNMAEKVVGGYTGLTCYDFGIPSPRFCTPWEQFNLALEMWFTLEAKLRRCPDDPISEQPALRDPFLLQTLQILRVYHGMKAGWDGTRIASELGELPESDLTAAAYEFFVRKNPEIANTASQSISRFLLQYLRQGHSDGSIVTFREVTSLIKDLHRKKDEAYRNAWKKRGELVGVISNIARKVDRVEQYISRKAELADESILDTAIDLFAYATKYRLFLLERLDTNSPSPLISSAPKPYSDHSVNFDSLVDAISEADIRSVRLPEVQLEIVKIFAKLEELATQQARVDSRLACAEDLAKHALAYTVFIARERPSTFADTRGLFPGPPRYEHHESN